MTGSRNKQANRDFETKFAVDALSSDTPPYLKLATASDLPVPVSASLSPDGISFIWRHPLGQTLGAEFRPGPSSRKVVGTLWRKFLVISSSSDENIRKFAERWGPLGSEQGETVEEWRRFADLANALVRVAAAVASDELGRKDDWNTICRWLQLNAGPFLFPTSGASGSKSNTPDQGVLHLGKALIVQAINKWFAMARGNILLQLIDDQPMIQPSSLSLLGTLAIQLSGCIAKAHDLFICFHCQALLTPVRALSRGTRQFCAECRKKKKPQMYAARDYRRRHAGRN
jgi:hypothetical protein